MALGTTRRRSCFGGASALALVVGSTALLAADRAAAQTVICAVRSIHGREKAGPVDKRLAFLQRQLSKPPFSAFKSFVLLAVDELKIARGQRVQMKLPTKKLLRLTFKDKLLGKKNRVRLRMHLSITPPRAVGFLPGTLFTIADRGTLLVAGDQYRGGTLIVGVTCRSK